MRTPREIYTAYNIMPSLQLHQLRVAAVAKLICDNFKNPIDMHTVITACLFHDMGNILKFDLEQFPEFLEPEGRAFWEDVKAEYTKKYGPDQHAASIAIAREIGLSSTVVECIDSIAFSKVGAILAGDSYEKKICEYADSRVGPHGILTLDERLRDGRKRYIDRKDRVERGIAAPEEIFEANVKLEHELEKKIFAEANITPVEINDLAAAPLIEELWEYPVE